MLLIIYVVWGVFLLQAARQPRAYASFLNFTMWANLVHGVLMAVQAATHMERYWSKWFTDIPFVLIVALGIYLWQPTRFDETQDLRGRGPFSIGTGAIAARRGSSPGGS